MARTRIESRARARALQALYAWEVRGKPDLSELAVRVWDDLCVGPRERLLARPIIRYVAANADALDKELAEVTTNWRLERIGIVEHSVLRLGAAELAIGDVPPRVVLQESIHLAERFGSEQSARFVNGVLDAIARRMGRL